MHNDKRIKKILPNTVNMTPAGFIADELSLEQYKTVELMFFKNIFEIGKSDIREFDGFGEFDEEMNLPYKTFKEFIESTFDEKNEGYWYNWREMFKSTILEEVIFTKFYNKMMDLSSFCEDKRFLVNNNTFFDYMITNGKDEVGFPDWTRSGITDFLLDFAIMDLNKPYFKVPERLSEFMTTNGVVIENFKERFLCMAFFKGLDTLRWHASIDDHGSYKSIVKSMSELEERIMAL